MFGAALILPAIVALIASNFAREQRPRAYGLVASAGAIAVAAGPLIGGLFTTYLSWRWVFVGEVLVVLAILALLDPAILRNRIRRGGLTSFFFQYLLQAGLFFVVPLFLSVALGLSAIETGVRLLPLSITLLLAAAGVPKVFPNASPRRVAQLGFLALFAGLVTLVAALDAGAGPEIVTGPMLLAGLGVGALASQLGSVTVSSVPDEQSGDVGGLQNTVTNLGASIGTALAGAVLISALTASFLTGIQENPDVPADLASKAQVELEAGIPFLSDEQLKTELDKAGVTPETADAIVDQNADARIDGLRVSLSLLALIALLALFFSRRIPTQQPSSAPASSASA